jgi:hypothetical protein
MNNATIVQYGNTTALILTDMKSPRKPSVGWIDDLANSMPAKRKMTTPAAADLFGYSWYVKG